MNAFLRAVEARILAEREAMFADAAERRPPPRPYSREGVECACGTVVKGGGSQCFACKQRDRRAQERANGPRNPSELIRAALRQHGALTARQLHEHTGVAVDAASSLASNMSARGLIRRIAKGLYGPRVER